MNIPDDLAKQIDEHAKKLHLSRTAYIVTSMSQKIQAELIMEQMPLMQKQIQELQIIANEKSKES